MSYLSLLPPILKNFWQYLIDQKNPKKMLLTEAKKAIRVTKNFLGNDDIVGRCIIETEQTEIAINLLESSHHDESLLTHALSFSELAKNFNHGAKKCSDDEQKKDPMRGDQVMAIISQQKLTQAKNREVAKEIKALSEKIVTIYDKSTTPKWAVALLIIFGTLLFALIVLTYTNSAILYPSNLFVEKKIGAQIECSYWVPPCSHKTILINTTHNGRESTICLRFASLNTLKSST